MKIDRLAWILFAIGIWWEVIVGILSEVLDKKRRFEVCAYPHRS